MGLLDRLLRKRKRPTEITLVCEVIADGIGQSFSSAQFVDLFQNETLSEGWTFGDALAVWYSLGNLALVVTARRTYPEETAQRIIDLCRPMLQRNWNMPGDVLERFLAVVGETEASAFAVFTKSKDGAGLFIFFGKYVSRILGAPVPFSERSTFEDEQMGIKGHRCNPILTAAICGLFVDICATTKKFLVSVLAEGALGTSPTFFTKVETHDGDVMVLTKTRYLLFFGIPRTSVMPSREGDLGRLGVQFRWTASDPNDLQFLHNSIVQTLREGVGLADLRGITDVHLKLAPLAPDAPFIPMDSPLPASLKQVTSYIKRVI